MRVVIKLPRGVEEGIEPAIEKTAREIESAKKIKEWAEAGLDQAPDAYDFYAEFDPDLDGRVNGMDNCPYVFNPHQKNSDGIGNGNACELDVYADFDVDVDGDSVSDDIDNCPTVWNPSHKNHNWLDELFDEVGDACDPDMDGDGVANASETVFDIDMDGDGELYTSDPDNDEDGVVNAYDRFDWTPAYF
jgi:hypothetical protein